MADDRRIFVFLGEFNRIESFGYGSSKPLKDELTDTDARVNRRVEFRLIKPDSDKPAEGGGEWK